MNRPMTPRRDLDDSVSTDPEARGDGLLSEVAATAMISDTVEIEYLLCHVSGDDGVFPASAVGRLRYWLQVIRIHARRVATQVIENKNGGDGSAMAHPRLAMSQVASGNRNAAKHPPVSVDVQTSVPYPAWGSVPAVDDIPRVARPRLLRRMADHVSNVLAAKESATRLRHLGDAGLLPASAHAKPGRVRRYTIRLFHDGLHDGLSLAGRQAGTCRPYSLATGG